MSSQTQKWRNQLLKLEGAVKERRNPFRTVLKSPSPSVNYIFGKGNGLPFGYSAILYGPYKGGKTLLSNLMIGSLHQSDPDAMALKFDAEYRSEAQLTEDDDLKFGIDPDRLVVVEGNQPGNVFNQIAKDVESMCQDGMNLKLIVIDSISGIVGRRELENGDVEKQTIGDQAQTVQIGLKMILPVIRKYKIALVIIAQARSEMDQWVAKRNGHSYKMQGSFGLKHFAEYFIFVERNDTKEGRADALGNEFVDTSVEGFDGKPEKVATKHRIKMQSSSIQGGEGRTGEFTFHKSKGLINTWEEIGRLAMGHNIVTQEGAFYLYGDQKWRSKDRVLEAIRDNPSLEKELCDKLFQLDSSGSLTGSLNDIEIELPE